MVTVCAPEGGFASPKKEMYLQLTAVDVAMCVIVLEPYETEVTVDQ
jgi:hypothetical protein